MLSKTFFFNTFFFFFVPSARLGLTMRQEPKKKNSSLIHHQKWRDVYVGESEPVINSQIELKSCGDVRPWVLDSNSGGGKSLLQVAQFLFSECTTIVIVV